jgi:hypothetical protein
VKETWKKSNTLILEDKTPGSRQVTSDSSKGATMMIIRVLVLSTIIKRVLFLLVVLLTLFQVTSDNLEEAIVAEGNILDEI